MYIMLLTITLHHVTHFHPVTVLMQRQDIQQVFGHPCIVQQSIEFNQGSVQAGTLIGRQLGLAKIRWQQQIHA